MFRPQSADLVLLDRGENTWAHVNLFGCTVTSWRVNNEEQLFVSRKSLLDQKYPITGGIHFVFPIYGPWVFGNTNGFAHIQPWTLKEPPKKLESRDIVAVFEFKDTYFTRSMWSYSFTITLVMTLKERKLNFDISITNDDKHYITFQHVIIPYLRFNYIQNAEVTGFTGGNYIDYDDMVNHPVNQMYDKEENMYVKTYTKRLYENTFEKILIRKAERIFMAVTSDQYPEILLWNPGPKDVNNIDNIDSDEWEKFLCVCPAQIFHWKILLPGETLNTNFCLHRFRLLTDAEIKARIERWGEINVCEE